MDMTASVLKWLLTKDFLKVKSFLPMVITDKKFLYLYPDACDFPLYFLPLSCWGGGVREQLDVCLTASQGQPTTSTVMDPQAPGESLLQCPNTFSPCISSDFDVYRVGSLTLFLSLHCQCSVLPFLKHVFTEMPTAWWLGRAVGNICVQHGVVLASPDWDLCSLLSVDTCHGRPLCLMICCNAFCGLGEMFKSRGVGEGVKCQANCCDPLISWLASSLSQR